MLRSILLIAVSVSVACALPIGSHGLASVLPAISSSPMTCEVCEASLGDLVHEAVEAGWMGEAMFKVCPSLAQKYNIPYEVCCTVAFLIEGDAFNHIVPDSVYYCEKLKFCPVLPHGAATLSSITVLQKATQSLVTVLINVTVTNATAAGEYELRLIPASTMQATDVEMPKYNAGLTVGVHSFKWEFSATSALFNCDETVGGCPGTYGMRISVCELECEWDTVKKHEGHAVLDTDTSHTFQIHSGD